MWPHWGCLLLLLLLAAPAHAGGVVGGVVSGGAAGAGGGPLGIIIGGIIGGLAALFGLMGNGLGAIKTAIEVLGGWTSEAVRKVTQVLKIITEGGLLGILKRIIDTLKKLKEKVGELAGKVIEVLQRTRSWLDRIYNRVVVPIINAIQHLRQILLLFKLLHLKWADKLDKYLVHLEVLINRPFDVIRKTINGILTTLEEYLDPIGTLQGGTFLYSAWRWLGELVNLIHYGRITPLRAEDAALFELYRDYWTPPAVAARVAKYQKGTLDDDGLRLQAQIRHFLKQYQAGADQGPEAT